MLLKDACGAFDTTGCAAIGSAFAPAVVPRSRCGRHLTVHDDKMAEARCGWIRALQVEVMFSDTDVCYSKNPFPALEATGQSLLTSVSLCQASGRYSTIHFGKRLRTGCTAPPAAATQVGVSVRRQDPHTTSTVGTNRLRFAQYQYYQLLVF